MKVIDSAFRKSFLPEVKRLETHLVFASNYYYDHRYGHKENLESLILENMKKYKLKTVMVTIINLRRLRLITKEAMESFCNGQHYLHNKDVLKEDQRQESVNDDLESLFEDLRLWKEPKELSINYFLPKLTKKELELVKIKHPTYSETLYYSNSDVNEVRMELSESNSKFVEGLGSRKTFTIENPSSQNIIRNCFLQ